MVLDVVVNWSNYYVIKCFWEVECYGTELNDLIVCTEEEELAHEKIRSSTGILQHCSWKKQWTQLL